MVSGHEEYTGQAEFLLCSKKCDPRHRLSWECTQTIQLLLQYDQSSQSCLFTGSQSVFPRAFFFLNSMKLRCRADCFLKMRKDARTTDFDRTFVHSTFEEKKMPSV